MIYRNDCKKCECITNVCRVTFDDDRDVNNELTRAYRVTFDDN